ncbi:MAG: NAD(+) synthase [Oceanicaulis sp.]|uniref:NAD(+) synthase n=1 Tax=Glycocaulis sp. TaxID=1969725 RepID=UPI0025C46271|nr:NAD(+) synthase [Glycocaulis sp.]MCC5980676.1 NAD(+) synthase [Oceanicaulis sp.]MCH8520847.1 NAD(+) synthase [Glycocaulis sp.]
MSAFRNLYRHGFVRVAAFAPEVALADPARNAQALIAHARAADRAQAALVLFPELSLTGYAIDDLHHQSALLDAAEEAARALIAASADLMPVIVAGCPVRADGQLFNCALVVHRGRLLGVVAKSYLPNYREFYEKRWFAPAAGAISDTVRFAGQEAPFGAGLIFDAEDVPGFVLGVDICEDLWAVHPPSLDAALAGASVIVNLSASNALIGKARERSELARVQSRRVMGAYLFAASGPGESTTDLAWDGQLCAHELGRTLAEGPRFEPGASLITEFDVERIAQDRLRTSTFRDGIAARTDALKGVRRVGFQLAPPLDANLPLTRKIARFPFVPSDPERLDEDCYEAWSIQVAGLTQRLQSSGLKRAVIGISGGLDSTQALIITARAFDRLGLSRKDIIALTLPGFATSKQTREQAIALAEALGVTHREIDIRRAAGNMLADIGHPFASGAKQYDVTFENVQAGLRTDYLFRIANHEGGLVIGTGDLSEAALGWCTYGVGDHMSHYNVNAGLPKTLIQHLIAWAARTGAADAKAGPVLNRILATEISPELIPADEDGAIQSTQAIIGPYALQDFTLHYVVRYGLGPEKIAFLADAAWGEGSQADWPDHVPEAERRSYEMAEIIRWLEVFLTRFFGQSQFKRSAVPNGPKLTSAGALSPRGDWRMPSDASARAWLEALNRLKAELGL